MRRIIIIFYLILLNTKNTLAVLSQKQLNLIQDEFNQLVNWQEGRIIDYSYAKQPENLIKNRYARTDKTLPNNHSRVVLKSNGSQPSNDYINANYIRGHSSRGSVAQKFPHILTQAPLSHTFKDFYHMIWQEQVKFVVMVTSLTEGPGNIVKANQYWPRIINETMTSGAYQVRLKEEVQLSAQITLRKMSIMKLDVQGRARPFRHFHQLHYTGWPDHDVPETSEEVLNLVKALDNIRHQKIHNPKNEPPIVVHCSAGVGRSATFVAIYEEIRNLRRNGGRPNVYSTVRRIKEDRFGSISSLHQYTFIYEAIWDFANF